MAHRCNQHFRAMSMAIGAIVVSVLVASAGICEASYSAGTPISKPSIDTPSFEPYWETDTVHELSASGAEDYDCNTDTGELEADDITYIWTATHGSFVGVNYGDEVDYETPSSYVTDKAEITVHANDNHSASSNSALYDESAESSDPLDVVVIEIDDLPFSSIFEDDHDRTTSSTLNVDYSESGSDTRRVLVVLSDQDVLSDRDFEWSASVNASNGNVFVSTLVTDLFMVETLRADGGGTITALTEITNGIESGEDKDPQAPQTSGKRRTISTPSQDLILLANHPGDDFLDDARATVSGEVLILSLDDAIDEINDHFANNGEEAFSLAIIDHGSSYGSKNWQNVGNRTSSNDGENSTIGQGDIDWQNNRDRFAAAIDGKVNNVTLYGCKVAKGSVGDTFLQAIADDGNATVTAYVGQVYARDRFSASENGAKKVKTP